MLGSTSLKSVIDIPGNQAHSDISTTQDDDSQVAYDCSDIYDLGPVIQDLVSLTNDDDDDVIDIIEGDNEADITAAEKLSSKVRSESELERTLLDLQTRTCRVLLPRLKLETPKEQSSMEEKKDLRGKMKWKSKGITVYD